MSLVIVSADDFDLGDGICRRVAEEMGFRYVGRDILADVAEKREVKQEELVRTLDELPGFMTRRNQRRRMLSFIQEACLERLVDDGVVCYGLGAHLYIKGVSHALKIRLINDSDQRAQALAKEKGISPEKALKMVNRQKENERRWSQDAYGLDQTDPAHYDMVLSMGSLEKEKVVEIVCDTASYRKFLPVTFSLKLMQDNLLAAKVRVALMDRFPEIRVESKEGTVVAYIQSLKKDQRKKQETVREVAGGIEGVRHVEVHVIRDLVGQAAQSCR